MTATTPADDAAFRAAADGPNQAAPGERHVTFTQASTIEPEIVQWGWEDRVPLGALTIIAGQPGLGKSTATIYMGAGVSNGTLPGTLCGHPAPVLYVTLEDHLASVVRPRLEAAGANLDLVQLIGVKVDDRDELVTLPGDLQAIEEYATEIGARLFVVDPIVATLDGSLDSHRDQSVRRALAPLAQFAERANLAVIGVMHLSKQQGTDLLNRVSGSIAFGGAARSVLAFARDPEDPDGDLGYDRVLVPAKANWGRYAPSLRCRIETASIDTVAGQSEQSKLTILGECDTTSADLTSGREPGELDDAIEFLEEQLGDGDWHPARDVKTAATQRHIAPRTLQRARARLEVEIERNGFPATSKWRLPVVPNTVVPAMAQQGWHDSENGSVKPNADGASTGCATDLVNGTTGKNGPGETAPIIPAESGLPFELDLASPSKPELAARCECDKPILDKDRMCGKCGHIRPGSAIDSEVMA